MGSFPITQINDNGTVLFQKGIINDTTNIRRINHSSTKQQKRFYNNSCFSFKKNDNGTVHFQQGIFNDNTDHTSMITHQGLHINILYFNFMISRTLLIGASAVYHVTFNC